jgi:hypothetical protein
MMLTLARIQSLVSQPDEFGAQGCVGRKRRHSPAYRDLGRSNLPGSRLQSFQHSVEHFPPGLRTERSKFVSTVSKNLVRASQFCTQRPRDLSEHSIALRVAEPIVDRLEIVKVEQNERKLATVSLSSRDLITQRKLKGRTIRQACYRIDSRSS